MKTILSYFSLLLLFAVGVFSCKKDQLQSTTSMTADAYVYNKATGKFSPTPVGGTLNSSAGVKVVFYYLQRSGAQDSLIQTDMPQGDTKAYKFQLKDDVTASLQTSNMSAVTGIKILVRNTDNSFFDQVIKVTYYDPAAPQFSNFATPITPAMPGTTNITGNITSEPGLTKVYVYDDSTGAFTVVDSIPGNNSKNLAVSYKYTYRFGAKNMKIEAIDIYGLKNSTNIAFVNVPFNPSIIPSAASFGYALPDGGATITGTITGYTNLADIKVYKVAGTTETLLTLTSIKVPVPASKTYNFSITDFPFSAGVDTCKIVVKDDGGRTGTAKIPLKELGYYYWKNVTMTAQGNANGGGTACFFIGTGTSALSLGSNCDLASATQGANPLDAKIDFHIFATSAGAVTFYNPANTSTATISGYKCYPGGTTQWNPANPVTNTNLKKTNFRVVPTTAALYNTYPALPDLNLATVGVTAPTANTVPSTGSNSFNLTDSYLIFGTIAPPTSVGGASKNILIRVTNLNVVGETSGSSTNYGKSTLTMDIMKEK